MYIPRLYKNDNIDEVKDFISANSFGILVSNNGRKLLGTHIPLMLEKAESGKDVLRGHLAKSNPQWKSFEENQEVLVIFPGPHTYVSSSWYDHVNVPTWNYVAVHIYGTLKAISGDKLLNSLRTLVDKYERDSSNPVRVDDMPEKFLADHIKGIFAFEIIVEEIQAAYKLSQNRDEHNYTNIIRELRNRNDNDSNKIADEMEKHRKKL